MVTSKATANDPIIRWEKVGDMNYARLPKDFDELKM